LNVLSEDRTAPRLTATYGRTSMALTQWQVADLSFPFSVAAVFRDQ
jgi:hypothetical protein